MAEFARPRFAVNISFELLLIYVTALYYENVTEPYLRKVDDVIKAEAEKANIKVEVFPTHTLWDPEKLLKLNGGSAPLNMTAFQKLAGKAGSPAKPQKSPDSLPPRPEWTLKNVKLFPGIPDIDDFHDFGYDFQAKTTPFVAGEDEAQKVMEDFLAQKKRTLAFEKPQTNPTALEPDTTALSPYMSNGSLSCRLFYHRLMDVYKSGAHSKPPVSLEGQLLWREMAHLIGYSVPNFDRMVGNPICRQIPWKHGQEAQPLLEKWESGNTGFPAIDAVMNQLRTEGWMHHLARHLTACFLTRGDLWVSWELGRDVFRKHLVDHDWAINNFSWHWLSCSAFFHQYFRCYSPIAFFKKTDPDGAYIRKHVPVLKKYPTKYIYEPWDASKEQMMYAKCTIGTDYPKPMVDHGKASKANMAKMKEAYDKAKQEKNGVDNEGGSKAKKAKLK